jgi:predicted short-subunit dehydrogenase-like oxidoreductase (DUF2520 family)
MKIVLLGSGNVASHLGPILQRKGHKIIQLFSHTRKNGFPLSKKLKCSFTTTPAQINPSADLYIVALKDDIIASFVKKLNFIPKLIVHTSGSIGLEVFPKKFKSSGVLYPLQTLSKNTEVKPDNIPYCIEGNSGKSLNSIRKLANSISSQVYVFNSDQRKVIHLAAVFANNFSNYLFILADNILKKKNIPFKILAPLITETAQKVLNEKPEKIQTGPAKRGDKIVMNKHTDLLNSNKEAQKIYKLLSKSIAKYYKVPVQ